MDIQTLLKNFIKSPDYTGAKADFYLNKYIDRPEDKGTLKGFQKSLNDMGIVAPPADMLNSAIYLAQGKWGMAGLSAASIIPFIGELKKGIKTLKNSLTKGDELITLHRAVRGIDDVKAMVKDDYIVGKWKPKNLPRPEDLSRKSIDVIALQPPGLDKSYRIISSVPRNVNTDNLLFTSMNKGFAKTYGYSSKGGMVLEFKVPKSYIKKHGRNKLGSRFKDNIDFSQYSTDELPSVLFTDGLPSKFLTNVENLSNIKVKNWSPF